VFWFAKDQVTVAASEDILQIPVFELETIPSKYALKMSTNKLKTMAFKGRDPVGSTLAIYKPLTEVFPWFFLSCKANARVKPAKTGARPALFLIFVLFYVLSVLCRSLYCLCVYVYCTTATGWLPNCSYIYHIIHHIIIYITSHHISYRITSYHTIYYITS
jgi:hypothetical protein